MSEGLERATRFGIPLVAVAGAASWFHGVVAGGDTWWHLAAGREITSTGAVLRTDPFSHTFAGRPWLNHEWLWDLAAWHAYRIDPEWLAWGNQLAMWLTFGLLFALGWRLGGRALAAGAVLWLAAATAHPFLDIRPQTAALGLLALFLLTRDRSWAPWLWAPLVVVWVNSHASFLFGVGAIGLHVLVATAEQSRAARALRIPVRDGLGLAAALLAVLANPYGIALIEHPLSYLDAASPYRQIAEWAATAFSLDPATFEGRFWILALVAGLGVPVAVRRDPYWIALYAVALVMAATSRRFIPVFCVCAVPLATLAFAALQDEVARRAPAIESGASRGAALALSALAAVWLWSGLVVSPRLFDRSTAHFDYSPGAVRFIDGFGVPVNLFNDFSLGGYLLFHSRHGRVFIDGRSNTLYDDTILADYTSIALNEPGFDSALARYQVDAVVVAPGDPLVEALQALRHPWRLGYRDFVVAVLVRPDFPAAGVPLPATSSDHEPATLLENARAALAGGSYTEASDLAREVIAADPLHLHAYRILMRAQAALGDPGGIERTLAQALRVFPRMEGQLRLFEAEAWLRLGDRERARIAFERARRKSPLRHADVEQGMRALDVPQSP